MKTELYYFFLYFCSVYFCEKNSSVHVFQWPMDLGRIMSVVFGIIDMTATFYFCLMKIYMRLYVINVSIFIAL